MHLLLHIQWQEVKNSAYEMVFFAQKKADKISFFQISNAMA